jgi:hypothetical protein
MGPAESPTCGHLHRLVRAVELRRPERDLVARVRAGDQQAARLEHRGQAAVVGRAVLGAADEAGLRREQDDRRRAHAGLNPSRRRAQDPQLARLDADLVLREERLQLEHRVAGDRLAVLQDAVSPFDGALGAGGDLELREEAAHVHVAGKVLQRLGKLSRHIGDRLACAPRPTELRERRGHLAVAALDVRDPVGALAYVVDRPGVAEEERGKYSAPVGRRGPVVGVAGLEADLGVALLELPARRLGQVGDAQVERVRRRGEVLGGRELDADGPDDLGGRQTPSPPTTLPWR